MKKGLIVLGTGLAVLVVLVVITVAVVNVQRHETQQEIDNYLSYESSQEVYEDEDLGGDIEIITSTEEPRFVNEEEFINSVPAEVRKELYDTLPIDWLSVYEDFTFISYDEVTQDIYAGSVEWGDYVFVKSEGIYVMRTR